MTTPNLKSIIEIDDKVFLRNDLIATVTKTGVSIERVAVAAAHLPEEAWDNSLRCISNNIVSSNMDRSMDIIQVMRGDRIVYKSYFPTRSELQDWMILVDDRGAIYLYKDGKLHRDGASIDIKDLTLDLCFSEPGIPNTLWYIKHVVNIVDILDILEDLDYITITQRATYSRVKHNDRR